MKTVMKTGFNAFADSDFVMPIKIAAVLFTASFLSWLMPDGFSALVVSLLAAAGGFFIVNRREHALAAAAGQNGADDAGGSAATIRALRHDLRNALSPAMLVADRLSCAAEPDKRKAGETIMQSLERATALITVSQAPTA